MAGDATMDRWEETWRSNGEVHRKVSIGVGVEHAPAKSLAPGLAYKDILSRQGESAPLLPPAGLATVLSTPERGPLLCGVDEPANGVDARGAFTREGLITWCIG